MDQYQKKIGMLLLIIGFIMIVINAIDYLSENSFSPNGIFIFGIIFVAIGLMMVKKEQ